MWHSCWTYKVKTIVKYVLHHSFFIVDSYISIFLSSCLLLVYVNSISLHSSAYCRLNNQGEVCSGYLRHLSCQRCRDILRDNIRYCLVSFLFTWSTALDGHSFLLLFFLQGSVLFEFWFVQWIGFVNCLELEFNFLDHFRKIVMKVIYGLLMCLFCIII